MATAAHTTPFRYPEAYYAASSAHPVPEATIDDIADADALVRLAIVALEEVLDTPNRPDCEELGSVNRSLFLIDRILCRVRDCCEDINNEAALSKRSLRQRNHVLT
jgi:hypothetical protein